MNTITTTYTQDTLQREANSVARRSAKNEGLRAVGIRWTLRVSNITTALRVTYSVKAKDGDIMSRETSIVI